MFRYFKMGTGWNASLDKGQGPFLVALHGTKMKEDQGQYPGGGRGVGIESISFQAFGQPNTATRHHQFTYLGRQ